VVPSAAPDRLGDQNPGAAIDQSVFVTFEKSPDLMALAAIEITHAPVIALAYHSRRIADNRLYT
tara:strand:- start:46863 stop:47054 length:192 start_codon:yes stop_codon:yes gene_type:complete